MDRIIRWEPFREARRMHETVDRLLDRSLLEASFSDGDFETSSPSIVNLRI